MTKSEVLDLISDRIFELEDDEEMDEQCRETALDILHDLSATIDEEWENAESQQSSDS